MVRTVTSIFARSASRFSRFGNRNRTCGARGRKSQRLPQKQEVESFLLPTDAQHTTTSSPVDTSLPVAFMVVHYATPILPPPLGQSNVSHRLSLSQQEKIKLCLTLSTFSAACFAGLLLLIGLSPLPDGFPALRGEYHSRSPIDRPDNLSPTTTHLWGPHSPYYPAGKYERSIREGCVVSQVNIASFFFFFFHNRSHIRSITLASKTRSPVPNFRTDSGNFKGSGKTSSCHQLRRPETSFY